MQKLISSGIGIIAVLWSGAFCGVQAQPTPGRDGSVVPAEAKEKIQYLKRLERNALLEVRGANWEQAQKALSAVDEARMNLGQRNLTVFAQALSREAFDFRKRGGQEEVWELLDWAERMAPRLPDVEFARARLAVQRGSLQPGRAIGSLAAGMKKLAGEISRSILLGLNSVTRILVSLLFALTLFGIILSLRKLKCLTHDFSHVFPDGTSHAVIWSLTLLVFLLPVILQVPLILTLGFWIGLGICYARPLERGLALSALALLAASSFFLGPMSSFLAHLQGGGTREMVAVQEREWGETEVDRLARWMRDHPGDSEAAFVLSALWKKLGEYPRALELLTKAAESPSLKAAVLNNRGNVLYAMGRKDEVIPQYRQAMKVNPNLATAHFNVSQLLFSDAHLTEGQQERARAKELDPMLVDRFTRMGNSSVVNRFLADEELPPGMLKNRFFTPTGRKGLIEGWLRSRLFWGWPSPKVLVYFFLVAALAVTATIVLARIGRSLVCPRCGKIACRRCHRFSQAEGLCSQCYFIYVRKGGIDPQERVIKEFEIQRYTQRRRWVSILLSLPLMGAGHFFHGRPIRGLLLNFFFWFFLSVILLPRGLFPGAYSLSFGMEWIGIVVAILGLVVVYILGMLSVVSLEEE